MRRSMVLGAVLALCVQWTAGAAEEAAGKQKLVHVVCLKLKDGAAPEQVKKLEQDFRALKAQIPQIVSYAGGANFNLERSKGLNHCSVLTFKSKEDLEVYAKHAAHVALVASMKDLVVDVCVLDFWEPE